MVATDLLTVVTVLLTLGWMFELAIDSVRMPALLDVRTHFDDDADV
jgi:hypothetical protein